MLTPLCSLPGSSWTHLDEVFPSNLVARRMIFLIKSCTLGGLFPCHSPCRARTWRATMSYNFAIVSRMVHRSSLQLCW